MELLCSIISIKGTVQGVGFRPFVYRSACKFNIKGSVLNNSSGVKIIAYGNKADLVLFIKTLRDSPPPLSSIRDFSYEYTDINSIPDDFKIINSLEGEDNEIDITPDTSTCNNCLKELNSKKNRRYEHPFINCTDCGPRYTIIKSLPYDRPNTTMQEFEMCPACKQEYNNPLDRRFHAQPVCCPDCGPVMKLLDKNGSEIICEDPVRMSSKLLENGKIIAVKSLGGFNLACRSDLNETILNLRKRKNREQKPFALMVRDIETAFKVAEISDLEENILKSVQKPIVLLKKVLLKKLKDSNNFISEEAAPKVTTYGIMLPYTPVHYLLFKYGHFKALIMTSANITDNPMEYKNDDAVKKLNGIADYFLLNNRDIFSRNDDSIVRVICDKPFFIRRARGYVPEPIPVPENYNVDGIIACGGILKNTITAGRRNYCYVSQHIGTMDNLETFNSMENILDNLTSLLKVKPKVYAVDKHPENPGAIYAKEKGLPIYYIQHHHAHAVSCMAENNITEKTVCITYDGTGYGKDNKIWGGEILIADYYGFLRFAHLAYVPMPGGDQSVKYPWRMAMGILYKKLGSKVKELFPEIPEHDKSAVLEILNAGVYCPLTSSMGRLFDALSALLGICLEKSYEGQPAIELEAIADKDEYNLYDFKLSSTNPILIYGPDILCMAINDFKVGTSISKISAKFHNTIAKFTSIIVSQAVKQTKSSNVCLSGGCFQNALLLERTIKYLEQEKINPITHKLVSPNDEGISYGQAIIAGAKHYLKK